MNCKITGMIISVCIVSSLFGQKENRNATCQNKLFDSMVARTVSFSIPVLDVDTLFNSKGKYIILDAREFHEYKVSTIPDAVYYGYEHPQKHVLKNIDKNTPILVYCSIGYRSEKIGEQLRSMGYTRVYNLYGSIFEWANRGYPLVRPDDGKPTAKIHGYNMLWSVWINRKKAKVVY